MVKIFLCFVLIFIRNRQNTYLPPTKSGAKQKENMEKNPLHFVFRLAGFGSLIRTSNPAKFRKSFDGHDRYFTVFKAGISSGKSKSSANANLSKAWRVSNSRCISNFSKWGKEKVLPGTLGCAALTALVSVLGAWRTGRPCANSTEADKQRVKIQSVRAKKFLI